MIDTACEWSKPLYLTRQDIVVMDKQTKRDVLAHNKSWQNNCENIREKRTSSLRF